METKQFFVPTVERLGYVDIIQANWALDDKIVFIRHVLCRSSVKLTA